MSILDELREVVESLTQAQRDALAELLAARAPAAAPATQPVTKATPIAIVGMSGRFPGARDVREMWSLLSEGRDAITEVPASRWDLAALYDAERSRPGTVATKWGGFLDDVDQFDAEFFGITPREAAMMDPQQRLFLEATWTALQDAGVAPSALSGSATGVFVGVSNVDYLWHQFRDLGKVDAYASSGSAHCIIANRISYLLNLSGPSLAVDTACSSSLVSVHLACQSLRSRECDLAVAGGVNLLLTPHLFVSLSDWGMMAKDGRCKTFDARADGFVRGEGCGAIVVKRLDDAQRDGDRVLAVIHGSAVNQDGKTNGLTAPSAAAQQAVVRQALQQAGLSPAQISYLETHGTGTSLGDPIEVEAINEIFAGAGRCVLGALKSNIGHLESAAGIAGLIKVVLALGHEEIPKNLHFQALNPHLELGVGIEVASEAVAWTRASGERFAGVSSFSFGGTNAHVVLGEAPVTPPTATASTSGVVPIVLSAAHEGARRQMAEEHAAWIEGGDQAALVERSAELALRRDHLEHRVVALGDDAAAIGAALRAFAEGESHPSVVSGRRKPGLRPVFVYTGQGNPWPGMGGALLRDEPAFRDAVAELDEIFLALGGAKPSALLSLDERGSLDRTDEAQPAIFTLQVALTRTLERWGVRPAAVAGHSLGEIAAAWAAGALSLEDAARVVHHRSRLMQRTEGAGAMVSVTAARAELWDVLERYSSLSLAAHNGVRSSVLSGSPTEIEAATAELEQRGVRCKRLPVRFAFHSAQMDPLRGELVRALATISAKPPRLPFFSTVTGQRERGALTADYWAKNLRDPVELCSATEKLLGEGPGFFLELGPHPAIIPHVADALAPSGEEPAVAAAMRRGHGERRDLLAAVSAYYVRGGALDWTHIVRVPDTRRTGAPAPAYPWQRKRHWIEGGSWVTPSDKADDLLYTTEWRDEAIVAAPATPPRRYRVIGDGSALAAELATHSQQTADDVLALFTQPPVDAEAATAAVQALRSLALELLASRPPAALTIAIRGHAALAGFARALAVEEPRLQLSLLELPATAEADEADAILDRAPLRGHAALRGGRWQTPRLSPLVRSPDTVNRSAAAYDPNGTYLITGGLGSLGLALAARLLRHGVRHLALVARRAPDPGQLAAIEALRRGGATVTAHRADLGELAELRGLLASLPAPLRGVFHAAGVVEDGLLTRSTAEGFARVLRPKLDGAWNLHQLTRDLPLSHFVLFSSASAVLGAAGQTSYAAANAFLEGLTAQRRQLGLPATCVHWGAWRDSAMVTADVLAHLERQGFSAMAPARALDALDQLLDDDVATATVIAADWSTVAARAEAPMLVALLGELSAATSASAPATTTAQRARGLLLASLTAAAPAQRGKLLYAHLRAAVLAATGMDAGAEVRPDQGLVELGLDSMLAVTISGQLGRELDRALPRTLIFDHPTLQLLTAHLLAELALDERAAVTAATSAPPATASIAQLSSEALAAANAETVAALLEAELASLLPA